MFPRTGTFYGLTAADLNRDGRPDICAANFGEGVTLWAGRAAGAGTASVVNAAAVVAEPQSGAAGLRENDVFKVVNGAAEYKIGGGDILEIALSGGQHRRCVRRSWCGRTGGFPSAWSRTCRSTA